MADEEAERAGAADAHTSKHAATLPSKQALDALLWPLQELCPSLDMVQELYSHLAKEHNADNPRATLAMTNFARQRLAQATLRAASSGDLDLLAWLCPRITKPPVDLQWSGLCDDEGSGPVNLAASSGHAEAVRLLVTSGANVNERDAAGWTPLMWAVNCSNVPLASYLLSHGADAMATTKKGSTCEDFILSAHPDAGHDDDRRVQSGLGMRNRTPRASLAKTSHDPASSDRSLIADLIFEHQEEQNRRGLQDDVSLQEANVAAFPSSVSESDASVASSDWSQARDASVSSRHAHTPRRRLIGHTERTERQETELRIREQAEGRRRALLDVACMLGVDYDDLLGETSSPVSARKARRSAGASSPLPQPLLSGCGAIEVGGDPLSTEFIFTDVQADQMLVFGEAHIQAIVSHLVHDTRPVRAPWTERAKPANVIYLCLRYACSLGDRDLLEDLATAFVEAIEACIYAHPTHLTHLSFWLYNGTLLLHYMLRDKTLHSFDDGNEYANLLGELVNEIYMFIIRDTERRIDKMLDVAILDHEAIEGLADVRYEDEWSFMRTLKGSVKGLSGSNGSPLTSPSKNTTPNRRRPLSQVFSNDDSSVDANGTPSKKGMLSQSPSLGSSMGLSRKTSLLQLPLQNHADPGIEELLQRPSPRSITTLLTSVLHILQLYEINPAVIVQVLSQVFFWVGREVFNRILMQRKYLCKARVMQIRLNLSALEDWSKTNALPIAIVRQHFAPAHQLISWILCQSSVGDFAALISTIQGLKLLNPAQLQRVSREYRYEVNEPHISDECLQYLKELQRNWERSQEEEQRLRRQEERAERARKRRLDETAGHTRSGTATQSEPLGKDEGEDLEAMATPVESHRPLQPSSAGEEFANVSLGDESTRTVRDVEPANDESSQTWRKAIDLLFAPGRSMADYIPPEATQSDGSASQGGSGSFLSTKPDYERLNSRDMLPFALPSSPANLVVTPGDAFGFGRGHFIGTGTPSLKDVRADGLFSPDRTNRATGQVTRGRAESISSSAMSPLHSPSKRLHAAKARLGDEEESNNDGVKAADLHAALSSVSAGDENVYEQGKAQSRLPPSVQLPQLPPRNSSLRPFDTLSASSSSSAALDGQSTTSSVSRLYPQGKGLAAGASWQPVPLLPDGCLDALNSIMRQALLSQSPS